MSKRRGVRAIILFVYNKVKECIPPQIRVLQGNGFSSGRQYM